METIKVGLAGWGEKNQLGPQTREDFPRLPYVRLKDGSNVMRVITEPYKYCFVKYLGPKTKNKYGDRVYTAWPTYDDCPAYLNLCKPFNKNPKKRYLVAVIDRSDQQIKIFDMSLVVYEQINVIIDEMKETTGKEYKPTDFDINVRYNSKSKTPNEYYHTMSRPIAPLSEADKEVIKATGEEKIEKILTGTTSSPKPERVLKRLESLGWVQGNGGGESAAHENNPTHESEADPSLKTPDDDSDYTFNPPSED